MTIRKATLTVAALLLVVAVMFVTSIVFPVDSWCDAPWGRQIDGSMSDLEPPPFAREDENRPGCWNQPWWTLGWGGARATEISALAYAAFTAA